MPDRVLSVSAEVIIVKWIVFFVCIVVLSAAVFFVLHLSLNNGVVHSVDDLVQRVVVSLEVRAACLPRLISQVFNHLCQGLHMQHDWVPLAFLLTVIVPSVLACDEDALVSFPQCG